MGDKTASSDLWGISGITQDKQGNFFSGLADELKLGYSQNAKGSVSGLQTQSVMRSLEVILITPHDRELLPNKMQSLRFFFWKSESFLFIFWPWLVSNLWQETWGEKTLGSPTGIFFLKDYWMK